MHPSRPAGAVPPEPRSGEGRPAHASPVNEPAIGRLQDLLARYPRPDRPLRGPWEMSAASVITPFLPAGLPIPRFLLDRFGRIHIAPGGMAIDQKQVVPWADIRQIRTRPAFEVVTESMIDAAVQRATFMLPPIPGVRMGAELVAHKAKEAVVSILLVALSGATPSLTFDIPVTVTYTGRGRRIREMAPGLFSCAVLALPGVSEGVLATAAAAGTPILRERARATPGPEQVGRSLSNHLRSVATHLRTREPPNAELDARPSPPADEAAGQPDRGPRRPPRRVRREYGC